MSVQQGTKAPFFSFPFLFCLGSKKQRLMGPPRWLSIFYLSNTCISKYHWALAVKGCHDTDGNLCQESVFFH